LNHAYYNAQQAQSLYLRTLSSSRSGIRATPEKLHELDNLITPLLKQGQPLSHIFASHAREIGCSRKTIYNYIEARAFTAKNIDLPRKVRYKRRRRKLNYNPKLHYKYREGRTYQDYQNYLEQFPDTPVVEMDTVKGSRNAGKVLLTLVFCKYNFMLIFIMPASTEKCVAEVFDRLTSFLGLKLFRKVFPLILTDNGVEFKDVEAMEYNSKGDQRTKLFYCDPQASWQKPHVEKNHGFIRRVLPKGQSLDPYSQEDMTLLANHINSLARDSLDGKSPLELAAPALGKKLLDSLGLALVSPDAVLLTPALFNN
jgi:IS30 family transposase